MAPKIFLTGASGYVGGEVLYQLMQEPQLKDASITCLLRSGEKADQVQKAYPNVRTIIADLDDSETIKEEASQSSVVLHLASTKHLSSSQAIAQGLQQRLVHGGDQAYWIQMSGATLVAVDEIQGKIFGEHTDRVWHGVKDADAIKSLIRSTKTRQVENLVLDSTTNSLRTALIPGPLIYGDGHGEVNKRSIQAPDMAKYTLQRGYKFQTNSGQNRWSTIHVADLGRLICGLVTAAVSGSDVKELWNDNGFYMVETGVVNFKDLSDWIYGEAVRQKHIPGTEPAQILDAQGTDQVTPHGSILLGTNAVFDFREAQQVPGWEVKNPSLKDTIADLVSSEAEQLKSFGHR